MKIYDHYGIPHDTGDIAAADALLRLKRESGSDPWPVIRKCINLWSEKHPDRWESYLFDLGKVKSTRKDRKFAASRTNYGATGTLRYTIDLPEPVYLMIRCIYDDSELPMNRQFFQEFGRRFPIFQVAEKI